MSNTRLEFIMKEAPRLMAAIMPRAGDVETGPRILASARRAAIEQAGLLYDDILNDRDKVYERSES